MLLIVLTVLFAGEDVNISVFIGGVSWLALFMGGAAAGFSARGRGYIHGLFVGLCWWLLKFFGSWIFFPGILNVNVFFGTLVSNCIWGTIAGICGVNYAIIRRQSRSIRLEKNI